MRRKKLPGKYQGATTLGPECLGAQGLDYGGSEAHVKCRPTPLTSPNPYPSPREASKARPLPPRAPSANQPEKRKWPQQTGSPHFRTPLANNGGPACSCWSSLPSASSSSKTTGAVRRVLRAPRNVSGLSMKLWPGGSSPISRRTWRSSHY